jgi:hypothetical protein
MMSVLGARARQNRSAQRSFFQGARAPSTESTFRALKCLYKSVYIFKLILSVCKAFKTMSKFFKSNNSLTFDINLLKRMNKILILSSFYLF